MIFNHVANGKDNRFGGWETEGDSIMRPKRMREAIRKTEPVKTGSSSHQTTFEVQLIGDLLLS